LSAKKKNVGKKKGGEGKKNRKNWVYGKKKTGVRVKRGQWITGGGGKESGGESKTGYPGNGEKGEKKQKGKHPQTKGGGPRVNARNRIWRKKKKDEKGWGTSGNPEKNVGG